MGDYFLEYEFDEEGTVIGRSITADDQDDWDTEPPQEPDPYEWWLENTVEGLKEALRFTRADADELFLNTDAILREAKDSGLIYHTVVTKLQALGYLGERVSTIPACSP